LGGHLISLGSPNPLLGVLALNVRKDRVQRSSEKFACLLDARSCGIATAILDKRKCRGLVFSLARTRELVFSLARTRKIVFLARTRELVFSLARTRKIVFPFDQVAHLLLGRAGSPCGPIVAGSSLPLPVSLGDALAEDEAKALAKGSSFSLVSLIGNVLCSRGSRLATVLHRL
jgi:hypothetical protein